jgi:regulator of nucleoside diphosphate kinase
LVVPLRLEAAVNTAQPSPAIVLSRLDLDRIEALLEREAPAGHERLRAELDRAEVREPRDMPDDVITMNSTARFVDEAGGDEHEMTLVYPRDAGAPGTVSILAPVGSALLGLRVGQQIDWAGPGGRTLRLRVLAISYQPEAAREFHR